MKIAIAIVLYFLLFFINNTFANKIDKGCKWTFPKNNDIAKAFIKGFVRLKKITIVLKIKKKRRYYYKTITQVANNKTAYYYGPFDGSQKPFIITIHRLYNKKTKETNYLFSEIFSLYKIISKTICK